MHLHEAIHVPKHRLPCLWKAQAFGLTAAFMAALQFFTNLILVNLVNLIVNNIISRSKSAYLYLPLHAMNYPIKTNRFAKNVGKKQIKCKHFEKC